MNNEPLDKERSAPFEDLFEMSETDLLLYLVDSPDEIGYIIRAMANERKISLERTYMIMSIALQRSLDKKEVKIFQLEEALENALSYAEALERQLKSAETDLEKEYAYTKRLEQEKEDREDEDYNDQIRRSITGDSE